MLVLVLSFLMAFSLVFAISPGIIRLAVRKGLVADMNARSSHKETTPCIGGVPIFVGIIFTSLLLTPLAAWGNLQFILAALVLVFLVGLKDDLEGLSPLHKILGLIAAIAILVSRGEVQLTGMYGLLGFTGVFPAWASMIISGFTLLVICNAVNLIDGINGLTGTVGTIISFTFGIYFFMVGELALGVLSMTTAGSLIAFLYYNITPAKTFMGDTGALVVGLLTGVMAIKFIDIASTATTPAALKYGFNSPIAVAVSILIIPLFDTIRVFTTRILRGHSPFQPDRRHIHHLLIDSGLRHMQATMVLGLVNMGFISLVFFLDGYLGLHALIALQLGIALLATFFLHRNVRRVNRLKALAEGQVIDPGTVPTSIHEERTLEGLTEQA